MLADAMVTDDLPLLLLTLVPAPRKRLVRALSAMGRRPEIQHHATRLVIDDFGDAVAVQKRCSSCMRWHSTYERGWCLDCKTFSERQRRRRLDEAARVAERERRRVQRLARIDRNPAERERERLRNDRNRAARRSRDPNRERELARARSLRYLERVRQDPERYQERLANMRVDNVLRRMDAGKVGGGHRRVKGTSARWARQYVPSAPLALALGRSGQRPRDVAASGELSEKVLLNWRTGEQRMATWGAADKLLVALDRFWWEVFDPEDAAPRIPLCRWVATDRARAAMRAPAPRRCAGSSDAFSGVRSRDVVAWIAAAEAAALLWDGGEWPVHCTGCGWRGEREGTDHVDACESGCPDCRGELAAGWPSTPARPLLALANSG